MAAAAASAALASWEVAHVWRRRSRPVPHGAAELLHEGGAAARETVAVLRAGYRAGPGNETALLNLFLSFGATFAIARTITHAIRHGRGPLRNVVIGRRHIHHFVPGILLTLAAGSGSIGLRHEGLDQWLALPFGAGAALIVDETALLLELEDVYWAEEGALSVDAGLGGVTALAALALVARMVRRGERLVLGDAAASP